MKGAPLSSLESTALLLVSVLLAFLTYFLVEKSVRHQGRKTVFVLCLLMTAVGFQGWNTYARGGLEYRLKKTIQIPVQQTRDFIKWEDKGMLPKGDCDPGFIYPEAHVCVQSNWEKGADIVVVGDSHAFSAYWGIAEAYENNHVVKLLGQGGCIPFLEGGSFGIYSSCTKNINAQLAWIANNSDVKTVFIIHRNRILFSDDQRSQLVASTKKTFDFLLGSGKRGRDSFNKKNKQERLTSKCVEMYLTSYIHISCPQPIWSWCRRLEIKSKTFGLKLLPIRRK
jgi:hypothetical protein